MTTDEKKPQLHVTALNMFSKCGEQFRRRYLEGEILPPGISMLVGTATDRSVSANLSHKIEKGELLTVDACEQAARDAFEVEWQKGGVKLSAEERDIGLKAVRGEAVDKAVRLSRLHAESLAPVLNPTHVDRRWVLELEGWPVNLAGAVDVQEGAEAVRDTKTSKKTPDKDVAESSDQLTMYAMAVYRIDGAIPRRLALDYLVDLKTPAVRIFETARTLSDFQPLLKRVEAAVKSMEAGVFMPAPSDSWICSERWCGYWTTCRFARRPASVSLTELEVA